MIPGIPQPIKGYLRALDGPGGLRFTVNPEELNRQESARYAATDSPGAPGPFLQYTGGGDRTISFEMTLDAIGTKAGDGGVLAELSALELLTYPATADLANGQFVAPPKALLVLGKRTWEGVVSAVDVQEKLFNIRLEPIFVKARVQFTVDLHSPTARLMHLSRRGRALSVRGTNTGLGNLLGGLLERVL